MPDSSVSLSGASLRYLGEGEYDAQINETVVLELAYDGSDFAAGVWTLVGLRIDGDHIDLNDILRNDDSPLVRWLEDEARKDGHLPDEPEGDGPSPAFGAPMRRESGRP